MFRAFGVLGFQVLMAFLGVGCLKFLGRLRFTGFGVSGSGALRF